ncbi:MAG TPA: inositol monophosphatase family protein [Gemmatimonadaceae bacterium]|nr:inositol monophosphatase family protein [Gemmatimonadaceae bacterium]
MTTSQAAVPYTREIVAKILDAMIVAARAAEGVITAGAARRGGLVWQSKGQADYLTEIDTSSEALIRQEITNALHADFPDLRVLGEESWRDEPLPRGLAFVVDPLDGTTNFLHGIPAYSVSIAAIHDTEPIVALVLDIPHGELYTAVRGMGARLNGIPLHVSQISDPEKALIGTGFPFGENADAVRYARQFIPIARTTSGIRRAGSAAIDLAWVAGGRFDAFWELHLSPWDMAAGILLVREAGGIVTGIDGMPATIETAPLVAGNPAMHGWLLDVLRGADGSAT